MDLLKTVFRGDKVVWLILLVLCVISIVEVFSASSTLTFKSGDHWSAITHHSLLILSGVVITIVVHNIPYKRFLHANYFLLPLSICMLAVVSGLGFLGGRVNGAARWLALGGIQFQPSELAKMAAIIFVASELSNGQTEDGAKNSAFKHIMWMSLIMTVLILPENYSTGMLLLVTIYAMMFIGRVQAKKLLGLGGLVATLAILFVSFLAVTPNDTLSKIPMGHRFTTVKERLMGFADGKQVPASEVDIFGDDAQVSHARIAIATSNVIGKGPGNSVERDFLSQAYSDFIFAIIIEELGLAGGVVVVFLYLWLLIRAGKIARRCDKAFPAFLVMGIALLLVTQATFNMMVAVGLAPVTGQPLPLISRGGTSIWINCAYIGMILSVSQYTEKLERQKQEGQTPVLLIEDSAAAQNKTIDEMTPEEMSIKDDTTLD